MKTTLLIITLLLLTPAIAAQDRPKPTPLTISLPKSAPAPQFHWDGWDTGMVATATTDILSSIGGRELHPVIGRGQFGGKQGFIAAGLKGLGIALIKFDESRTKTDAVQRANRKVKIAVFFIGLGATGWNVTQAWRAKR